MGTQLVFSPTLSSYCTSLAFPGLWKERKNKRELEVRKSFLGTVSVCTFFKSGLIFGLMETVGTIGGTLVFHSHPAIMCVKKNIKAFLHSEPGSSW